MSKIKRLLLILPAIFLFSLSPGVLADHGSDDLGQSAHKTVKTISENTEDTTPASSEDNSVAKTKEFSDDNEIAASKIISDEQTKVKTHSQAERQKNCQAAEKGLETKLSNLQKNSAKQQSRIDAIYKKALDYKMDKNLNPDGFSDLTAKADNTKSDAAAAVAALNELTVKLDCTSSSVATTVATFKAAAQTAKDKLHAYKLAVKDVLTSLEMSSGGAAQ